MGIAYEELGDLDRAIEYVERCVAIDQEINHPDLASDRRTLERLKTKRAGGGKEPESPEAMLRGFIAIYREQGEGALRQTLQQAGFPDEMLEMTMTVVQSMAGDEISTEWFRKGFGAHTSGDYQVALEHYRQSLFFAEQKHNLSHEARAYHGIGFTQYKLGHYDLALVAYKHAINRRRQLKEFSPLANTLYKVALIYQSQRQWKDAIEALVESIDLMQEHNITEDTAQQTLQQHRDLLNQITEQATPEGNSPTPSDTIQQDESDTPDDK